MKRERGLMGGSPSPQIEIKKKKTDLEA